MSREINTTSDQLDAIYEDMKSTIEETIEGDALAQAYYLKGVQDAILRVYLGNKTPIATFNPKPLPGMRGGFRNGY